MADTPAPTPVNPALADPGAKKKRAPKGAIPQDLVDDLSKSDQILLAARELGNRPRLAKRGLADSTITNLDTAISQARTTTRLAVDATDALGDATTAETTAFDALVAHMQHFQDAARLEYMKDKAAQRAFYIGENLSQNRANLEQYSQGMFEKLTPNPFAKRGITDDEIAAFHEERKSWVTAQRTQTSAQKLATDLRTERDTLLVTVNELRMEVQLTAQLEWPHTNPDNATIRKSFSLPPDRPLQPVTD